MVYASLPPYWVYIGWYMPPCLPTYPPWCIPTLHPPSHHTTLGTPLPYTMPAPCMPLVEYVLPACWPAGEEALGSERQKSLGERHFLRSGRKKCDGSYVPRAWILCSRREGMDKDWIANGSSKAQGALERYPRRSGAHSCRPSARHARAHARVTARALLHIYQLFNTGGER